MQVKVYDEDANALTADDNANNTADYAGGSVGTSKVEYRIDFKEVSANKNFQLGAFATFYCGDEIDDYYLNGGQGWSSMGDVPDKMDASFSLYDDTNASTTCYWKHIYAPSSSIMMGDEASDVTGMKQTVSLMTTLDPDDSTGPSANGDSYFGGIFLDSSYDLDLTTLSVYKAGDSVEDPGAIGLDENPESTYSGLQIAYAVEPQ
jgi:hypothetical protein